MENEILVSIICTTYNHEPYIANAIESFLMQKANFKYEILIHDDASTDKTAEIIREYEKKYPDIIKPIYQKENQYSKGVKVETLNRERAVGKYYAICEGDDYWTDPYKLQKQIDFLENNPDYSLCVHGASMINASTNEKIYDVMPSKSSRDFSTEEVIIGGGSLFATNSMVYRRKESEKRPDFYNNAPIGDYPLTIFLSLIGKVYYIDEIMSIYRYLVPGSWTERELKNIEKRIKHFEIIEKMLREVDEYTEYKYSAIIKKTILKNKFYLCLEQGKFDEIKKGELREFYNELNKKEKFLIYLKKYSPKTVVFLKKAKKVFS